MKIKNSAVVLLISCTMFVGCSVTPHVNITDSDVVTIDSTNVDFSKEMKKHTLCTNPRSLDGELTIMKAAKEGGISKVKYVTKENRFETVKKPFSLKTIFTKKCITVYGE